MRPRRPSGPGLAALLTLGTLRGVTKALDRTSPDRVAPTPQAPVYGSTP